MPSVVLLLSQYQTVIKIMVRFSNFNKYSARRTYSELCQREFDSKAEARRGEELTLLERAGEIEGLDFQIPYVLNSKPKITIKIDFVYRENGVLVREDCKGVMTREFRVKLAWLKQKYGIEVRIVK